MGGDSTGLWRESFSHYRAIPSGLASGMWPCLSSKLTSESGSRLGHSTHRSVQNHKHISYSTGMLRQSEQHVFVNP